MVAEINQSVFKSEVLDQQTPVLVDFWAPWCGPCRMMAPMLEELAQKYGEKLKVVKINTDENQEISAQSQITGIPCLILYKNGTEVDRFVGVQPVELLSSKIDSHL